MIDTSGNPESAEYSISMNYSDPNENFQDGFAEGYSRGWKECWDYLDKLFLEKLKKEEGKPE